MSTNHMMPAPWGITGGPGRPKGARNKCGRSAALRVLDRMMADGRNLKLLRDAMQAAYVRNPMAFFVKIIMPLLPKDVRLEHSAAERAIMRIEFGLAGSAQPSQESAAQTPAIEAEVVERESNDQHPCPPAA